MTIILEAYTFCMNTTSTPDVQQRFVNEINDAQKVMAANAAQVEKLMTLHDRLVECFRSGHKAMICGNGGSASDAMHISGEYLNRERMKDRRALPLICLTGDAATITGIGNDFGFEQIYARQVDALGRPGDILILLSTSGQSANILAAQEAAAKAGVYTVAFSGGGPLSEVVDLAFIIDSTSTERIQEATLNLLHMVTAAVEEAMN